jgi:hypothetical protein
MWKITKIFGFTATENDSISTSRKSKANLNTGRGSLQGCDTPSGSLQGCDTPRIAYFIGNMFTEGGYIGSLTRQPRFTLTEIF